MANPADPLTHVLRRALENIPHKLGEGPVEDSLVEELIQRGYVERRHGTLVRTQAGEQALRQSRQGD